MGTRFIRGTWCAVAMLALAGCASSGGVKFEMPKTAVKQGQSRMILYVQNAGLAAFKQPTDVSLDGNKLCTIDINEVLTTDLAPGRHVLTMDTHGTPGVSVLEFLAEDGKTVFMQAGENSNRRVMSALLGFPGVLLASDKSSPNGGHFYVKEVSKSAAAVGLQEMSVSTCGRPPGESDTLPKTVQTQKLQ